MTAVCSLEWQSSVVLYTLQMLTMHLPLGLSSHLPSLLPHSRKKKKSNKNKSHKSFLNEKQAHVGMEPSKTSHKGWEWHYNTFTPPLHLVPFLSSESVQTQNVKQLYVSRLQAISKREHTVQMVQGWQGSTVHAMYTVWKSVAIEPLCLPAMLKCLHWDFSSYSLIPRPNSVAFSENTNGAYNHKANQVELGITRITTHHRGQACRCVGATDL